MDAADGRLVAGVVEWLIDEVLLDVRLKPADQTIIVGVTGICETMSYRGRICVYLIV